MNDRRFAWTGAILGDVVGSRFEWHNIKTKEFRFLDPACSFTDDSVMTLAVADALVAAKCGFADLQTLVVDRMQKYGRRYPGAGYGGSFSNWIYAADPRPYNSLGNGSAMRVSVCAWVGESLEEVKELSRIVTSVTHNHPEGLKGAEATAVATYLARIGKSKEEIRNVILRDYYAIDFTLDEIRDSYRFDVSCQGSVPQALEAFFESVSFEDAIRNAVSIGGDSDTIAAICGAVAGAYYELPYDYLHHVLVLLGDSLREVVFKVDKFFETANISELGESKGSQFGDILPAEPVSNSASDTRQVGKNMQRLKKLLGQTKN